MMFNLILIFLVVMYFINCIKILREYERGVIFRLGRVLGKPKGPGVFFIFWPIDKMERVSLRTVTLDVPSQDVITRDNVSIKVNAVVYFRVVDPNKAVIEVEDYMFATSQMAQTTLRSVVGQVELDELLAERGKINLQLQEILDKQTDPWGIKVSHVETKHVDLPDAMRSAMARQAEAERERRAKVISAEGELQAAEKLVKAAEMINSQPISLQMRYLQTLIELATKSTTTTIFPVPIDLFSHLLKK